MKILLSLILIASIVGCKIDKPKNQPHLYTDVLSELFEPEFCNSCLPPDLFARNLANKLRSRKIDSAQYFATLDSLKNLNSKIKRPCILEYSASLDAFFSTPYDNDSTTFKTVRRELTSQYAGEFLQFTDLQKVQSLLSSPASLSEDSLSHQCLNVLSYVRSPNSLNNHSSGVISFSKAYYSAKGNHAVLYYEFLCGRKCGRGELLFVERNQAKWKIIRRAALWFI